MAADIFVSYSSKDEQLARAICARLRDAGVSCWIACENTAFGESYAKTITENLLAAKVVLVCMSRAAGESPHVERELDMAVNGKKTLLPVLLEDFNLAGTYFQYYAGSTHYMRFEPTERFRVLLVQRARELTEADSRNPADPVPTGGAMGILEIQRTSQFSASLRAFKVLIDKREIGGINAGETKRTRLPAGMHTFQVKMDFYKSREVSFLIRENDVTRVKCGIGNAFTMKNYFRVELV